MSVFHRTDIFRCIFCTALLFACAAVFDLRPARAELEEPYAEEWIFEIVMPPFLIADGVTVYQLEGRHYLPLVTLAEGFEFFIEPDLGRGYVSGWAASPENSFIIDAERGELVYQGEKRDIPENAVLDFEGIDESDMYVQLEVLNDIWPVNMQVDLSTLSISVEAEETLPFQARLERQEVQERALIRKAAREPEDLDLIEHDNGYLWLGKPAVDIQTFYSYDSRSDDLTGNNSITGTQQFARTTADYSASFAYDREGKFRKPSNIRLKLEREAFPDEDLLFGLKNFKAGDVNVRHRDLIGNSSGGRGVQVDNMMRNSSREFDTIVVEGAAPPGWEIELYNNNELITFGEVEDDGEYRFEDVLLRYGNNRIRVVLYGPQGQVREVVENYNFGGDMLPVGDIGFSAGAVDSGRALILLENDPRTTARGVAANTFISYGLSSNATVFGSASKTPTTEGEKQYLTTGAAFPLFAGIGRIEGYKELGGGTAFDTRFLTDLLGIKLNIRNSFFRDFESQDAGFGESAKTFEGEYRALKNFRTKVGMLGLQLRALHRKNESGDDFTDLDSQQSFSRGGFRVTNAVGSSLLNREHQRSSGQISTTVRLNQYQVRGNLSYSIYPEKEINSGQFEVRYKPRNSNFQAAATARHDFLNSISGAGVQAGYDFGKVLTTFETDYQQERGWVFGVRASTSLNPYQADGRYDFDSRSLRTASPVRAHVFLDKNADGVFSEELDEPLEDARIRVDKSISRQATNEEGYVVHNFNRGVNVSAVTIEEASLVDPYFKPAFDGYRVRTVPGTMPTLEFPIIETGAIDGTIYYPDDMPVPGITVELVDEEGEVIRSMQTAYDGFYSFEFVRPGTYTVRVDPSYGVDVPPQTVTVDPEELFLFGIDMQLEQEEDQAAEDAGVYGPYVLEDEEAPEAAAEPEQDGESDGGIAQTRQNIPAAAGTSKPAPRSDDGSFAAVVRRVRIGEHPDKVRFVMDLSAPVRFEIQSLQGGQEIVVDLPDVAWNAIRRWRAQTTPIIQGFDTEGLASFETEALENGGTRLRLLARDTMNVKQSGLVRPYEGYGDRLFIDLVN